MFKIKVSSFEVTQESIALVLAEDKTKKRHRTFTVEVLHSSTNSVSIVTGVHYSNIFLLQERNENNVI